MKLSEVAEEVVVVVVWINGAAVSWATWSREDKPLRASSHAFTFDGSASSFTLNRTMCSMASD